MGKKVEEALLGYTVARAKAAGADQIVAPPVDGPRNEPAKSFFASKFLSNDSVSIDPSRVSIPSHISLNEEI
jgi:predicted enzyme involved in methoxymalonyl-ACP biosynthesis